jgi:hypothetical protein
MKKAIKIFVLTTTIIFLTAILLFGAAFAVKPFGDVFFSFCIGSCYVCNGEAVLYQDGRKTVLPVYKAADKPFLLLGPYNFGDYEDFFFVNKKQVIGTAIDKGGDAWFRIGKYLFILDDLNHWDVLRIPWWDYMSAPVAKSEYDTSGKKRVYIFPLDPSNSAVRLEINGKFFTEDMLGACNVTIGNEHF